jgi:hypothetical protein
VQLRQAVLGLADLEDVTPLLRLLGQAKTTDPTQEEGAR